MEKSNAEFVAVLTIWGMIITFLFLGIILILLIQDKNHNRKLDKVIDAVKKVIDEKNKP